MFQELNAQFHSIIKSLDVLYVIGGVKPCSRILVHQDNLGTTIDFLNKNDIKTAVSDFKLLKQNEQSRFYSDKSIKIKNDDPRKGHFIAYLSKDNPNEAKEAEEANNHIRLGIELGYPECCCEFFSDNFDENNADLTLDILKNSNGFEFHFYTNIAARHFDINLLSHFPCSFNCEKSIGMAKNNLELIKKHSIELANIFEKTLKNGVLYTKSDGIFILQDIKKTDNIENKNQIELIFNGVLTTTMNELFQLLQSNKKLELINKNKIRINGVAVEGEDKGFMVFC
ncbi:hypothetical protein HYX09_00495 [Candidatus Woesearchaeota archaeon]|nr:hypothetical protein [Candidatus Woesearchaeota archaeon]